MNRFALSFSLFFALLLIAERIAGIASKVIYDLLAYSALHFCFEILKCLTGISWVVIFMLTLFTEDSFTIWTSYSILCLIPGSFFRKLFTLFIFFMKVCIPNLTDPHVSALASHEPFNPIKIKHSKVVILFLWHGFSYLLVLNMLGAFLLRAHNPLMLLVLLIC